MALNNPTRQSRYRAERRARGEREIMVWISEAERVRLDRLLKANGSDTPGQRQRGYTSILSQALTALESQFTQPPTAMRYGLVLLDQEATA